MKILVTGASGQLGAYLLDRLATTGHDVSAWGGSSGGKRGEVILKAMDLTRGEEVRTGLVMADPDAIIITRRP